MPSPAVPYTFTYVRIPADDDKPYEELTGEGTKYGDSLLDILKPKFAGGSIKNADGLRAEYGAAVDEKMSQLNLVAAAGSVEVFALVRPASTTRPVAHSGTYFYLDEMGVLKDLPVNRRAIHLAASCGLDAESPFLGDIYIGRVCVDPSPMHNANFSIAELDSGSVWLRSAPSENEQYHMAMGEYNKAAKEATAKAQGVDLNAQQAETKAVPGSFKWQQTSDDVEVTVALPEGTAKRDVTVALTAKRITVKMKSTDAAVAEIDLFAAIRPDESTWTFGADKASSGGLPNVAIMAEKADCVTWNRLEAATDGKIL